MDVVLSALGWVTGWGWSQVVLGLRGLFFSSLNDPVVLELPEEPPSCRTLSVDKQGYCTSDSCQFNALQLHFLAGGSTS